MSIKSLKHRFRIEHIVHRCGGKICIGSAYCPKLITIDETNMNVEKSRIVTEGELLDIYNKLKEAEKQNTLRQTVESPNTYSTTYTVFYDNNGKIETTKCEKIGFPNVTLDGELMYDNSHFQTRKKALQYAQQTAKAGLRMDTRTLRREVSSFCKFARMLSLDLLYFIRVYILKGYM